MNIRRRQTPAFGNVVCVFQRMGSTLERRKTQQVHHLAELCQILDGFLDGRRFCTDVLMQFDLEDRIARGRLEQKVGDHVVELDKFSFG